MNRPAGGVVVAQLGARRHYAVARALESRGLLERLVTDACGTVAPWSWLDAAIPQPLRPAALRRLLGRNPKGVPAEKISAMPLFTLSSALKSIHRQSTTGEWARRNAAFARMVVKSGAVEAGTIYAFNGAALEIFRHGRERGVRTILDQTAAPWRWNARLLRDEAGRWPGWEVRGGEIDDSGLLSGREEAEWELADQIVCGSGFVVSKLAEMGVPSQRCVVVPYAAPESVRARDPVNRRAATERDHPLKVLFAGTLQLPKGIQYLLEAARSLPKGAVNIRAIGPSLLSPRAMAALRSEMEVVGAVPRPQVSEHLRWADVLVLPTLSEGSANVIVEALSNGVPVVTTSNAGSVVQDGVNGLVVPMRDADALASAMLRLAQDEQLRTRLGASAAGSVPAFAAYADRLAEAVMRGAV